MTQVRRRYVPKSDYDERLPFGGKVVLAKKKKPQSWIVTFLEQKGTCTGPIYGTQIPPGKTTPCETGAGVKRNHTAAFQWFRKAADQGHPHSAYNLAVGHMQGYDTDVKKGEAHDLIKYALDQGVEEAHDVYHRVCTKGHCVH
ncbi:hypothetical protein HNY73_020612 [Argiope bruennichi]|uniref:Uncharacterized protein n=1 Tax=Argiope bruennichi TaxID=94029 RepID=A0A8T0E790_ARGBR|nr:hypothetical protein HNY73_020612 [Argiope bruennichi]